MYVAPQSQRQGPRYYYYYCLGRAGGPHFASSEVERAPRARLAALGAQRPTRAGHTRRREEEEGGLPEGGGGGGGGAKGRGAAAAGR